MLCSPLLSGTVHLIVGVLSERKLSFARWEPND